MNFLKRNKWTFSLFILLGFLFFASRLYHVLSVPIFTDEAIYIRWAQIAKQDPSWRFISLTDGKQPSFVWVAMSIMRFVKDPLLAGRLVSVAAGFATMIGLFFLGGELFKSKKVGLFSSLLYILFPMALVYDRMALYDSLVAVCAVWAIYFEILLVRKIRLDIAFTLALVLGAGILTKTSGFLSMYLSPFSLLLFDTKSKNSGRRIAKWFLFIGFACVLAYGYYTILRLSPFFHIIDEKNTLFVYTFKQWLTHPFTFLKGNISAEFDWAYKYLTPALVFLVLASFILKPSFLREKLFLFLWFLAPFFALALFGRVLYPRFIFFMTVFLLPLAGFSIASIIKTVSSRLIVSLVLVSCLLIVLRSDFLILNNFQVAPIPGQDLEQYINNWPAGGGIKEIIAFLDSESKKGNIYVASEGTFGSLPTNAVEIYLDKNTNVKKRGIWPLPINIPKDLIERSKTMPVFFIFNDSETPPPGWPLQLVAKYQKGIGSKHISLYKVLPIVKQDTYGTKE